MAGPGHWGIFLGVLFPFYGWILVEPTSASLLYEDASFDIRSIPSGRQTNEYRTTRRPPPPPSSSSFLEPIDTGTTLIAIRFQEGGVVVAADTRTSLSGYVSHRLAQKIHALTPQCVVLRSGSSADTQHLVSDCAQFCQTRWYRNGGGGGANSQTTGDKKKKKNDLGGWLSISQIAQWLRSQLVGNDDDDDQDEMRSQSQRRQVSVSLLIAGYDPGSDSGKIYSLASTGALVEENGRFAVAGSGSIYVLGYLEQELTRILQQQEPPQQQQLPSREQAIVLCQRAIEGGIQLDGASGGAVRIVIVDQQGMEEQVLVPQPRQQQQQYSNQNPKPSPFAVSSLTDRV